jgi:trehalose 6-phosphate phosphatase
MPTDQPAPSSAPEPADLVARHAAFFLDFDGTLVELAQTPDAVIVSDALKALLARLSETAGGALAIVSGRAIESIDALLAPLKLPVAGLHGAECRFADGTLLRQFDADPRLQQMQAELERTVAAHPGMLLETKAVSLALHFRNVPEREPQARAAVEAALAPHAAAFTLQPGKMVYEIKPAGVDKGRAIAALLEQAPFAGRIPCFAGDDLTDEAGFASVNALGGLTIKVGAGDTVARLRVPSVADLLAWLNQLTHLHDHPAA